MSESMIDRVARALCLANGEDPDKPSGVFGVWWKSYRDEARAAIEAMREPTEEMMESAASEFTFQSGHWGPETTRETIQKAVFQRAIDAALSEKP
jgi:hypothetical protein